MSHELSVSIARRGAKVDLDMESAAFGVISIDGEQIPAEERPGTAKKLRWTRRSKPAAPSTAASKARPRCAPARTTRAGAA